MGHVGSVLDGPVFTLAHAGLSVRGRIDPERARSRSRSRRPWPRRPSPGGLRRSGRAGTGPASAPRSRSPSVRVAAPWSGSRARRAMRGSWAWARGARPSSSSGMRCPARGAGDRPGDGRAPRASPRLPRTRRRGRSSRAPSSVRRPETCTSDSSVPRGRRARRHGRAASASRPESTPPPWRCPASISPGRRPSRLRASSTTRIARPPCAAARACAPAGWAGRPTARRTTSCSPWPSRSRCGTGRRSSPTASRRRSRRVDCPRSAVRSCPCVSWCPTATSGGAP